MKMKLLKLFVFIMYCNGSLRVCCHRTSVWSIKAAVRRRPDPLRFLLLAYIASCCSHTCTLSAFITPT